MVVTVGLTLVEPLADVDVIFPGEMPILAAPVVAQLKVVLEPEVRVAGIAVKELMVGLLARLTVTVAVEVAEPAALVAVRV